MPDDFPDKTKAKRVNRYAPPLTQTQLSMLQKSPYESEARWVLSFRGHARRLVELGLLEENPSGPGWFRVTEAGADVVRLWSNAGFKP